MNRRKKYLVFLGMLVALVASAVAVAASTNDNPTTLSEYEAGKRAQQPQTPDLAQAEAFGILRRSRNIDDEVPAQLSSILASSDRFAGLFGANIGLSRHIGAGGSNAWVIPGDGAICFYATTNQHPSVPLAGAPSGGACQANVGAIQGKLSIESESDTMPGIDFVAGLVPDGVTAVTLELSDDTRSTVPVTENVYAASARGHVSGVAFDVLGQAVAIAP